MSGYDPFAYPAILDSPALSPENAALADEAIAKVQKASDAGHAALDAEWSILTTITGSQSARSARVESVRQTDSILEQLHVRRVDLTDTGLEGFLQLAAAAADVSSTVAAASRMTPAGVNVEVVQPTIAGVKSAAAGALDVAKWIIPLLAVLLLVAGAQQLGWRPLGRKG